MIVVLTVALVSRNRPATTIAGVAPTTTAPQDAGVSTVPASSPPTGVAPVIAASTAPGEPVSPDEARDVAMRLWQVRMTARAERDAATLRLVDAGPALEADLGYLCAEGCRGPDLTALSTTVTVPPQTSWPVDLFATVTFELPDCPSTPCDDSFVAQQASPGAPWKVVLFVTYSGPAAASRPQVGADGFAAPPGLPDRRFDNLPAEYAQYLQSLKDTGRPPGLTRLAPGGFTTGLVSKLYDPPAAQQARGEARTVEYFVAPTDPVWRFAAENGSQVMCGTIHYEATAHPIPGGKLVQPDDHSAYDNLAPGTYSSIVITGLHSICFQANSDPSTPIGVFGSWGDVTHVSGIPA